MRKKSLNKCQGGAWVVTKYPDGTEVHSHPQHNREEEMRAAALGYPNVEFMALDHDPLHHIVSGLIRDGVSQVITGEDDPELADAEEHVVLAVQRYLNVIRRRNDDRKKIP